MHPTDHGLTAAVSDRDDPYAEFETSNDYPAVDTPRVADAQG